MKNPYEPLVVERQESVLQTNTVLRQTYMLLSVTLLFSAVMAGVSMMISVPRIASIGCSIAAIVLLWFVLPRTANSSKGIGVVFAITGLLGFGLGPILSHYLSMPGGSALVMQAMGGTGLTFVGLSAFALVTKKDFSFLRGFIMVGFWVLLISMIMGMFLQSPMLHIMISAGFMLFASAMILYETSAIIRGGETNYIMATASLYVSIYNLFVSLLHLLGLSSD